MSGDWENAPPQPAQPAPQTKSMDGWETAAPANGPTSSDTVNFMLNLAHRVEQNRAANSKLMANGWGTGLPKFAYDAGANATDLATPVVGPTAAPVIGGVTNAVINGIPSFMTMVKGLPGPTSAEESAQALASQRQSVLDAGKKLGLKVPPTQVNPSFVNTTVESVGGKSATAQQMADANEKVAYQVAQREAGLAPNEPITAETLAAARTRMSAPHREIESLPAQGTLSQPPFQSPGQTLKDIQQARNDAKDLWIKYNRQGNPADKLEARRLSQRADLLDQQLEAQVTASGRPDLAEAYRQSRVALAKNFTIARAMKGSSFDPASLSRLESRGSVPLNGDLDTIMDMYRDFPQVMKAPQSSGSIGVHQLMPWLGSYSGGIGGALLHGAEGSMLGVPIGYAAGVAAPMAARSFMMSAPYQRYMANMPQQDLPSLFRMIANPALSPYTQGMLYQQ